MKVFKHDPSQLTPASGAIFSGPVSRRAMVGDAESNQNTAGIVSFAAGGRTRFHTHTFDQLLYITEGEGIVATEETEHRVRAGDLVLVPAGEKHWHGATPETAMVHLTIGAPGSTEVLG